MNSELATITLVTCHSFALHGHHHQCQFLPHLQSAHQFSAIQAATSVFHTIYTERALGGPNNREFAQTSCPSFTLSHYFGTFLEKKSENQCYHLQW